VLQDSNGSYGTDVSTPDRLLTSQPLLPIRSLHSSKVDFGIMRDWIGWCQATHGDACAVKIKLGTKDFPGPKSFRVINCRENAVIHLPRDCDYIALSYVWGDQTVDPGIRLQSPSQRLYYQELKSLDQVKKMFGRTSNSTSQLFLPLPDRIPKTVADAMEAALARLGTRGTVALVFPRVDISGGYVCYATTSFHGRASALRMQRCKHARD
jgi:hypothetical protein